MSDHNKEIARAVFDVWNGGDLGRLDALVAADVLHHDPYDPHAAEGLEGMKTTIASTREAFPDVALEVVDQIAEGDKVATRWHGTMSRGGGGSPVGTVTGITIDRFRDGLVEAWRSQDRLTLLRTLGLLADG